MMHSRPIHFLMPRFLTEPSVHDASMDSLAADYSSSASSVASDQEGVTPAPNPSTGPIESAPLETTTNGQKRARSEDDNESNDAGSANSHDESGADEDDDGGFEVVSVTPGDARPSEQSALELWVRDALKSREDGNVRLNEEVRKNRNFKNPVILQKMILYCGIDEYATNLPVAPIKPDEFYDAIAERQRRIAEKR